MASTWSITLPVAAGVFLGSLMFGLMLLAYWRAQAGAAVAQPARLHATATDPSSDDLSQRPDSATAARDAEIASLPRLPGLIEANRRQLKTACIAGTIGHRQSNGWAQAVARNAPRRCIATSQ